MKTLSITQTREQLSTVIQSVRRDDVIIQNRGRSKAVIIPFTDYELLREAREKKRISEAVAELKQLAQEISARAKHLSEEEAYQIADEVTRESIEALEKKGKIKFAYS